MKTIYTAALAFATALSMLACDPGAIKGAGAGDGAGGAFSGTTTTSATPVTTSTTIDGFCCVEPNGGVICGGAPAPGFDASALQACPVGTAPGDPCDDAGGVFDKGGGCCHECLSSSFLCVACDDAGPCPVGPPVACASNADCAATCCPEGYAGICSVMDAGAEICTCTGPVDGG